MSWRVACCHNTFDTPRHYCELQISVQHITAAISRALDLRLLGRRFESCLGTTAQWPWASYLDLCASVTKQYNLVLVKGQ